MEFLQRDDVLCPYYKGETPRRIYCEGLCREATTSHFFNTKSAYIDYRHNVCCKHYTRCWHFRAMDRKNNQ